MYESIISALEDMGIEYTEDFETGALVIDIELLDKMDVITIIGLLVDQGEVFDINDTTITISSAVEPIAEEEELDLDSMLEEAL